MKISGSALSLGFDALTYGLVIDTMSKGTLKTNIIKNVCKSEAGSINEQT